MSKQLHQNFIDEQIKLLLKSYVDKEIKINYILSILGIKRRRFFELLARYKKDPDNFSIQYNRKTINRKIDQAIETNIIKELKMEKDLIKNKDIPIKWYNYSYIKDLLEQKYNQKVSLPTIINRAKRNNFYFLRPKRKAHDQEVITNYPGELIQHDSSHHQFAPYAARKWYLITSLDDPQSQAKFQSKSRTFFHSCKTKKLKSISSLPEILCSITRTINLDYSRIMNYSIQYG